MPFSKGMDASIRPARAKIAIAAMGLLSLAAFFLFPRYSTYRSHVVPTVAVALAAMGIVALPRLAALPVALGKAVMRPSPRVFDRVVFVVGVLFFSALSFALFQGTPVLDDDISAFFQARIFLSGHLTVPAPQPQDFFPQYAVICGRHGVDWTCSMYPAGHPALLAIGLALGVPWLVIPLLASGVCVLAAAVGRLLFDERVARLAALTCLTSPMFDELGATYLGHVPAAFGILLAVYGVLRCLDIRDLGRPGRAWHGLLAGLGVSLTFLCRPADAFVSGLAIGMMVLAHPVKAWRSRLPFAVAALVLSAAVLVHVAWTQVQTGDWHVPGHTFCLGGLGRYGFFAFFGPARAVFHAKLRAMEFGAKATGWPVCAFFPALLPLLSRGTRGRALWLWLFPLALTLLYFFFYGYEQSFPARYMLVGLAPLILLASAGWSLLADGLGLPLSRLVFAPALLACAVFLPFHFRSFDDHWSDVDRHFAKIIDKLDLHNAVVIQDEVGLPAGRADRKKKFFAAAFIRNTLDFRGDIVYVRNQKERNAELRQAFPGREIYLYRFRSDINMSELYREEFDPRTGRPSHVFLLMDEVPHYVNPDLVTPTIPDASRERIPLLNQPRSLLSFLSFPYRFYRNHRRTRAAGKGADPAD